MENKTLLRGHILPRRNLYDGEQVIPLATPSFFRKTFNSLKEWVLLTNPNIIKEHESDGESYGKIVDVEEDKDGMYVVFEPSEETLLKYEKSQLRYVSAHIIWDFEADDYDPAKDNKWYAALVETSLVSIPRFIVGQEEIRDVYVPTKEIREDKTVELRLAKSGRALTENQMQAVLSFDSGLEKNFKKIKMTLLKTKNPENRNPLKDKTIIKAVELKQKYNKTLGEKMTEQELLEMLEGKIAETVDNLLTSNKELEARLSEKMEEMDQRMAAIGELEAKLSSKLLEDEIVEEVVEEKAEEVELSEDSKEEEPMDETVVESLMEKIAELEAKLSEYEDKEVETELEEAGIVDPKMKETMMSLKRRDNRSYQVMLSGYRKGKDMTKRVPNSVKLSEISKSAPRNKMEELKMYMDQGLGYFEAKKKAGIK